MKIHRCISEAASLPAGGSGGRRKACEFEACGVVLLRVDVVVRVTRLPCCDPAAEPGEACTIDIIRLLDEDPAKVFGLMCKSFDLVGRPLFFPDKVVFPRGGGGKMIGAGALAAGEV